ncbi:ABC transporter ATP-binding protein [Angustibacter aerolatus]|uniref:ABC transporter ATP-binding protein n=1 Tax=Angustibacter aerolatus TaxID=1162965 RepID=A0ABQ6JLE4_9ACTN|nr:ABC transporter ATP-binding protein [Angustibacter aerolatus]GMA87621.1 ABC transporter ATP-binding protein [Angustibacter aerolatus]
MPRSRTLEPVVPQTIPPASVAVRATALRKVHGTGSTAVTALEHADLDVHRGTFTAVMGPSGSGKSTLVHCLAGLDEPTSGVVWVGGRHSPACATTSSPGCVATTSGSSSRRSTCCRCSTRAPTSSLPSTMAGRRVDRAWFDDVVTRLGIADRLSHLPSQLSGGQQQRVAIARALLSRPDVVFADEPTGNLDSRSGAQVLSMLRASTREVQQTVIMVTHDPVAAAYADRVVLLADGRVAGEPARADRRLGAAGAQPAGGLTCCGRRSPACGTRGGAPCRRRSPS